MNDSNSQESTTSADAGLLASAGALVNSKLALANAEARLAIISIVLIVVAALAALIFGIGVLVLLCLALSQWLSQATSLTPIHTLLIVAGVNLLCVTCCAVSIWRLSGALRFKYSLAQEKVQGDSEH